MSLKQLFGLEDMDISDIQIMAKIKEAYDKELDAVEFMQHDGTKVIVKLPRIDFSRLIDPWDTVDFGRAA